VPVALHHHPVPDLLEVVVPMVVVVVVVVVEASVLPIGISV